MTDASPDGRQPAPQWKRIVLKLSGEALSGHGAWGVDIDILTQLA